RSRSRRRASGAWCRVRTPAPSRTPGNGAIPGRRTRAARSRGRGGRAPSRRLPRGRAPVSGSESSRAATAGRTPGRTPGHRVAPARVHRGAVERLDVDADVHVRRPPLVEAGAQRVLAPERLQRPARQRPRGPASGGASGAVGPVGGDAAVAEAPLLRGLREG